MSEISLAELDQLEGELLPERAVLSTISGPGFGRDGGASFAQGSQSSYYHAGPDGATAYTHEMYTNSEVGNGYGYGFGGFGGRGLLGGLLGGLGL